MKKHFFEFIRECALLMNINDPQAQGKLIENPSWYYCFDDGLTPEQAVLEYQSKIDSHNQKHGMLNK